MGFPILVRWYLCTESTPDFYHRSEKVWHQILTNYTMFEADSNHNIHETEVFHYSDIEHQGFINHWHIDSLLNSLFRLTTIKTWKLCISDIFWGKAHITIGFPPQRACNHHDIMELTIFCHPFPPPYVVPLMAKRLLVLCQTDSSPGGHQSKQINGQWHLASDWLSG